jgi:hypothetical protein
MRTILLFLLTILLLPPSIKSQDFTQNIKGIVIDKDSRTPLPGATIVILGDGPPSGTTTALNGEFRIEGIKVGRYDIQFRYIGYKDYIAREILVTSGKETVLQIELEESVESLKQVEITASSNKSDPMNSMATVSARQVSMEEAGRYAGGFDDPARLVTSYAGVTYGINSNAIVIRGNSPKGLLWQMEGVPISNPNHFGDYITLGGGALTALSSQTVGSADFFTGAFPAEYGNALSGVFDIKMRNGNPDEREYTLQAGLNGIDVAAEGPFKKGAKSTYLFNYRYSTLGLLAPILPPEMGVLKYQDLSFKLNFPVGSGTLSVWGIGAYDYQGKDALGDSTEWKTIDDQTDFSARLTMGATGVSYKNILSPRTFFQATLAATQNGVNWTQSQYDTSMVLNPEHDVQDYRWQYTFTANLIQKFSARHTNKTGISSQWMWYDILMRHSAENGEPLITYGNDRNHTFLIQAFSQSNISVNDNLKINAGLHADYFTLNGKFALDPRIGVRWNFLPRHTAAVAYGIYSQIERIQFYLTEVPTPDGPVTPNKHLGFNKSQHIVLAYEFLINENLILKAEPYVQFLYDIPVVPGSYISTINLDGLWELNDSLVNEGKGRNIGIDLTLEKYLAKGYYYLVTASIYDSRYTGGDGVERNTRYNKGYVINLLGGKEWRIGGSKQDLIGANFRFTYMGGDYIVPVDEAGTSEAGEIVLDYARAYEEKLYDAPVLSMTLNYQRNRARHASVLSFQIINALGYKEFEEFSYDPSTNTIHMEKDRLIIPNISYKIMF